MVGTIPDGPPGVRPDLTRNSVLSVLGFVAPLVILLGFTPPLVRVMGVEQYGLWTVALSALGFMSVFELGLGISLTKFVAEYGSTGKERELSGIVTAAAVIYLCIGIGLTLPLYLAIPALAPLFSDERLTTPTIEAALRLAALGFLPLVLKSVAIAIPNGFHRYGMSTLVSILHTLATLGAALAVAALGGSVIDVTLSSVVVAFAVAGVAIAVAARQLRAAGFRFWLTKTHIKRLSSYVLYTSVAGIGIAVFSWLDKIVVGATLGLAEVTYYSVCVGIAGKILGVADTWSRPVMPAASAHFAIGEISAIERMLKRYSVTLVSFLVPAAVVGWLGAQTFLSIWMGEDFAQRAAHLLQVLVLIYASIALNAPAYQVANGIGLPWIGAVGATVGGALTIVGIVVLSKHGLIGAGWGNAGYLASLVIPWYVGRRLRSARSHEPARA